MLVPPIAEDQMGIGFTEILLVLIIWAVPAALLFFFLYWTIRLAIRHEKRRLPTPPGDRGSRATGTYGGGTCCSLSPQTASVQVSKPEGILGGEATPEPDEG
jgi:hypothetical protein